MAFKAYLRVDPCHPRTRYLLFNGLAVVLRLLSNYSCTFYYEELPFRCGLKQKIQTAYSLFLAHGVFDAAMNARACGGTKRRTEGLVVPTTVRKKVLCWFKKTSHLECDSTHRDHLPSEGGSLVRSSFNDPNGVSRS